MCLCTILPPVLPAMDDICGPAAEFLTDELSRHQPTYVVVDLVLAVFPDICPTFIGELCG